MGSFVRHLVVQSFRAILVHQSMQAGYAQGHLSVKVKVISGSPIGEAYCFNLIVDSCCCG